jgi:hypothetical protein
MVMVFLWVSSVSIWLHAQDAVTVSPKLVSYPTLIVYNGKIMTMDDETTTTNVGSHGREE